MRLRREVKLGLGLALVGLLALAPTLWAQAVTTGTLSGAVTLKEDGTPAPGVAVEAVHQPTGTRYSSVTRQDGGFKILNVRVGGP